jgi:hypothetical protein
MESIKFQNSNGDALEFTRAFPYIYEGSEGLGNPEAEPLIDEGFQQDGVFYYGSLLKPREIVLNLVLKGSTIADTRQKVLYLMDVFSPSLDEGIFEYSNDVGTWKINGAVVEGPLDVPKTQSPLVRRFEVVLFCKDPAFSFLVPNQAKLEGFINGLTLPTQIPIEVGLTIGSLGPQRTITYQGSADSYLLVEFRGEATRPKVQKQETGEFIEVEIELLEGESLFVNTDPNDKDVYKIVDGNRVSAFNYITKESSYPIIKRGANTFNFSAASGEPEVYLTYYDRFIGVK